jgi:hypothetical protein
VRARAHTHTHTYSHTTHNAIHALSKSVNAEGRTQELEPHRHQHQHSLASGLAVPDQTPCRDALGTMHLVIPKDHKAVWGPRLTRGAPGLWPIGWPAGHTDAAAEVPRMLLVRCRCPAPWRQHHFSTASASSCCAPSAAPPGGLLQDRQPRRRGAVGSTEVAAEAPSRVRSAAPGEQPRRQPKHPSPAGCASPAMALASATDNARQPIAASPRAAGGDQSERKAQGFPPPLLSRLVSGRGGDAAGLRDGGGATGARGGGLLAREA